MPTSGKAIAFSMPPEMDEQVHQVLKEEGRTMSEFHRDSIRLYMEEREWLRRERRQRAKAHPRILEPPDSTTPRHCPPHRSCHAPPSPVSSKPTAQEYLGVSLLLPNAQQPPCGHTQLRLRVTHKLHEAPTLQHLAPPLAAHAHLAFPVDRNDGVRRHEFRVLHDGRQHQAQT